MKGSYWLMAVIGAGLSIIPGSHEFVRAQGFDTFYESGRDWDSGHRDRSRHGNRRDGWSDASDRDSRSEWGNRRQDRDDFPSRRSSDPDVIVRRAYQDILNREPDAEGLRVYRCHIIDDHWSEQDVRRSLRNSPENAGKTPAWADAVIRRAYQDVLGRDPDPSGLATYREKLLEKNWSERDVRSDLKHSEERRETGGISKEQARQMVRQAYRSVLGRDPDSGSDVYVQKIMQEHWSADDVAKALRNSPEYRQKRRQ